MQAHPQRLFAGSNLDRRRDDHSDAGESVRHRGEVGAIAEAEEQRVFHWHAVALDLFCDGDTLKQRACYRRGSAGVDPLLTE
jgi:hypothetical protein